MTTPYPYQLEDVRYLHRWGGRGLLAWEPGLGKSYGALLWAKRHPQAWPILIICPASLKWNWQRECLKHFHWRADVLEGSKPPPAAKFGRAPQIAIVNYDILIDRRLKNKRWQGWLETIQDWQPQLIIIDECQKIGNRASKRTKAVRQVCAGAPHVIALSGTPIVNRPAEFFPTLNILRPDLFPAWFPYAHRFCGPKKTPWGWDFKGATNTKMLNLILRKNLMLRRRKEDVLEDLPKKRRLVTLLDLDDHEEYAEAADDFIAWLRKNRLTDRADRAERSQGLVRLTGLLSLIGRLKLPSVVEWVQDFLDGCTEKLIVFAIHQHAVRQIHLACPEANPVCVTGETLGKKRQLAFDQFVHDPRCRLFVGNIEAAGTGWNALGCSNTVFAELAWQPGAHHQAGDRVHGIGRGQQGKRCDEWWLVAKGTIEERLCHILQSKQRNLSAVLDGRETVNSLDVYDQLCQKILKTGKEKS